MSTFVLDNTTLWPFACLKMESIDSDSDSMPDNSEPRSDTSDSAEAIIPAKYNTDEYIYPRSTHLPSIFEAPTDTIPLNKGTLRTITDS